MDGTGVCTTCGVADTKLNDEHTCPDCAGDGMAAPAESGDMAAEGDEMAAPAEEGDMPATE
ncbi:hypothetical protein CO174_00535 [Candidatus Uhrbacteria bacterium CG_4_9_14_3_um_filter_50_9]|uniref:Uncharacterized protein n=1 Tax=Candidatus Uhrbacteria bacterium CG_4_9_14_3_um_filter_50_9 TaxID=1975035 RepID=A0A2M7XEG6_9BACT|nr:MAG: hypothetical protein CO174_00535 [Candidatus Uhrbacteria bacterium CG_4_9_14_3_um_filter_50_9]